MVRTSSTACLGTGQPASLPWGRYGALGRRLSVHFSHHAQTRGRLDGESMRRIVLFLGITLGVALGLAEHRRSNNRSARPARSFRPTPPRIIREDVRPGTAPIGAVRTGRRRPIGQPTKRAGADQPAAPGALRDRPRSLHRPPRPDRHAERPDDRGDPRGRDAPAERRRSDASNRRPWT